MRTTLLLASTSVMLALPTLASADVHISGSARVSAGVSVGVGYGPPPAPYYPPAPVYYAPPPPAPVYYAPPEPCQPVAPFHRLAIGLYMSSSSVGGGDHGKQAHELDGAGGGLVVRWRVTDRFELEGLVGQDRFADNPRIDTRLGVAGLLYFGHGQVRPFVLLGMGANIIQPNGEDSGDDEEQLPSQGYVEGGFGVALEITPSFVLTGEVRAQARRLDQRSIDRGYAPALVGNDEGHEGQAEARITGLFYF
jgi:hypothetical protein